jgi:hypothetical protein
MSRRGSIYHARRRRRSTGGIGCAAVYRYRAPRPYMGPISAIFLSHVFGAALGTRVALGRPLTRRERRAVFVEECRFLLVAVPPLAILVVLAIAGVSYTRIIQVIVLTGVLSLGVWGGVGGRRAGMTGWALVLPIAYGLLLGGIILALQALLQPGHEPFRP